MSNYTRPDFSAIALITIDVQCDFLDGQPAGIAGTSAALPRMKLLAEAFRNASRPIIHMVRLYKADGSNADLCRRHLIEGGASIVRPGTVGAELAASLLPVTTAEPSTSLDPELLLSGEPQPLAENEWALYKPRWGAFYQTVLLQHLDKLGITTLAFCGCNFPNCPRTSIYEASERDFRIVLAEDAISGLYPQGRSEMANIGVTLMSTAELIAAIESSPSA
jgi:nicotinamidase-related amidase